VDSYGSPPSLVAILSVCCQCLIRRCVSMSEHNEGVPQPPNGEVDILTPVGFTRRQWRTPTVILSARGIDVTLKTLAGGADAQIGPDTFYYTS
jgi:hypothetical protein